MPQMSVLQNLKSILDYKLLIVASCALLLQPLAQNPITIHTGNKIFDVTLTKLNSLWCRCTAQGCLGQNFAQCDKKSRCLVVDSRKRRLYQRRLVADLNPKDMFGKVCKSCFARFRARADIETLAIVVPALRARMPDHVLDPRSVIATSVVCFAVLHLIHRRWPICTASNLMVRQGFKFTAENVKEIADVLSARFTREDLEWEGHLYDVTARLRQLASGMDEMWAHAKDVADLMQWTVAGINKVLPRRLPAFGDSAPTRLYCRTLSALAAEVRGDGVVAPMCTADWDLLVNASPGTTAAAKSLGLLDMCAAERRIAVINQSILANSSSRDTAAPFDLYDLSSSLYLYGASEMLRYHVDEGLPFIGEGDFIPAHSADIVARRGGSIAPSTAERPVKRLRTKSRARTPNVLGNAISLSNTTSESREVVADVGGTTGVDEALPPISEDNVIPAHSANVDASRGGSIAPPIAAGPVKRQRAESRARTPNVLELTSFFQEWAKCWVPHKKDFCKGGHCSSCSLQLSLKHASRLWKTYKYCPGGHFYDCDKKLRMQRLGLVTQLGALIDKHGGDNVIIADIPVSSWELIVAELPPAKLRKRGNLPSAAVAVEGNLS